MITTTNQPFVRPSESVKRLWQTARTSTWPLTPRTSPGKGSKRATLVDVSPNFGKQHRAEEAGFEPAKRDLPPSPGYQPGFRPLGHSPAIPHVYRQRPVHARGVAIADQEQTQCRCLIRPQDGEAGPEVISRRGGLESV